MAFVLTLLLALITIALSLFGLSTFGISLWPAGALLAGVYLLIGSYLPRWQAGVFWTGRILGVLSALGAGLLLLASTIGGGHMAESNQVTAVGLVLMAITGCALFMVRPPQ
ncbi:hypothetical protein ACQUQU_14130 [Thalassolituus sp. LLYu03]|uniref:hypothetical protein n=1 Tax=Thalassolituus sp. LLYu03 TaxID=3421656 RepID=UPI003D2844E0